MYLGSQQHLEVWSRSQNEVCSSSPDLCISSLQGLTKFSGMLEFSLLLSEVSQIGHLPLAARGNAMGGSLKGDS